MILNRLKYLNPIIGNKQKQILRKLKIRNKTKTHRPNQNTDSCPGITQRKTKKMRSVRLKSTE